MAIKTKELIANAFIHLCSKKSISKITVKDIIEESSVGRQTFYNHFPSKEDLIIWIFQNIIMKEVRSISDPSNTALLECIAAYYSVFLKYKTIMTNVKWHNNENTLFNIQFSITYQYYSERIRKYIDEKKLNDETLQYAIRYTVYGQTGLFCKWIEDGMKTAPEIMATYAVNNISPLIRPYLSIG